MGENLKIEENISINLCVCVEVRIMLLFWCWFAKGAVRALAQRRGECKKAIAAQKYSPHPSLNPTRKVNNSAF